MDKISQLKNRLHFPKMPLAYYGIIPLCVYFFLAFLPFPQPIETGLDPSWRYAIGEAAAQRLVFGKDVVFTCGSLGYLISGYFREDFFPFLTLFRLLVYCCLWVITVIKITKLETVLQKGAFLFCFLLAFLIYFRTNHQILFIFLVILSFENSVKLSFKWWSLGLGALSGFALMTKFSLGIAIVGSLTLFLLGKLYQALREKTGINEIILAIFNSLIAGMSVSFILLSSAYYLTNFFKVVIALIVASFSAFGFWFIQSKERKISLMPVKKNVNIKEVSRKISNIDFLTWNVFYSVSILIILTLIIHSFPSLVDYLKNSLEISSGYSIGMSLIPYSGRMSLGFWVLCLAIINFFLIGFLIILVAKEKHLAFSMVLFFSLFFSFKHGFVRQDGHIFMYALVSLLIIALCLAQLKSFSSQKFAYSLLIYTTLMIFIFESYNTFNNRGIVRGLEQIAVSRVINQISYLNLSHFSHQMREKSDKNLEKLKLPENVLNVVKGKTIDIIPWEISLVAANELNWKPRPIFQSYSAYTTKLDHFNFESFSKAPRDYIFYNFLSIDGRHPFFDEPQTFSYVFCNYQPSSTINDFINLPALSNTILLEKRNSSRCFPSVRGQTISIPWNTSQSIETTNQVIIRADVKFQYSILGKIYKAIFRIPPVMMQVTYQDGYTRDWRIIPENSENGVIVSHLPRNDDEAMSFFQGNLLPPVKSFKFNTVNPWLYNPKIKITFSSEVLQE